MAPVQTVLIVDDEPIVREGVVSYLRRRLPSQCRSPTRSEPAPGCVANYMDLQSGVIPEYWSMRVATWR